MMCKRRKHFGVTKTRMKKKHRDKTTVGQPIHTTLDLSSREPSFKTRISLLYDPTVFTPRSRLVQMQEQN